MSWQISGDTITAVAREHLQHDKPGKAWKFLHACVPGLSIEQALGVLRGRLKLEGVNTVELVPDDPAATQETDAEFLGRVLADCQEGLRYRRQFESYRPWAVLAHQALGKVRGGPFSTVVQGSPAGLIDMRTFSECVPSAEAFAMMLVRMFEPTAEDYEKFWSDAGRAEAVRRCVHAAHPRLFAETRQTPRTAPQAEPPTVPRPVPVPGDIAESDDVWILPDGKFYPCRWMEHIQLARDLGVADDHAAARLGWVRVGVSQIDSMRSVRCGDTTPTDAQLEAVEQYCTLHHMPVPTWAGGDGLGFRHPSWDKKEYDGD